MNHDNDTIPTLLARPSLVLNPYRPLNHLLANSSPCARRLKMSYLESEVLHLDKPRLRISNNPEAARKLKKVPWLD
jgi:hypothetical protein